MKISIIVPVYNSESYLTETLNALAKQTYRDIEVILVDDGSTDRSREICERFAGNDPRFSYYRQENAGPSAARNAGLQYATGTYVGFCDSDDLPDEKMYETLASAMETGNADFAFCDIFSERDNRAFGIPWEDGTVFQKREVTGTLLASMIGNPNDSAPGVPLWGSVVRCLFRRCMIEEQKIAFPQDIHFAEDLVFTGRYLRHASCAVVCNAPLYYYTCNENSIMHSFYRYKPNMYAERRRLIAYLSEIISGCAETEDLQKRLLVTERCYYKECVGNACRDGVGRTAKDKKEELEEILNDPGVCEAFRSYRVKDFKNRLLYRWIRRKQKNLILFYYEIRFKGKG